MRISYLLPLAVLVVGLPGQGQQPPRDPNHPLPPPASPSDKVAPLSGVRQADVVVVPPRLPVATGQAAQRRSAPRPAGRIPAAQSDVLFDRPLAGGSLWAIGHDWKASFDGRGFEFIPFFGSQAPRNFPLRLELDQVTVGDVALPLTVGQPEQVGWSVRTARGALTEVVDATLRNVEQSWVFATLPNRGALRVEVRIGGDLAVENAPAGLRFANEYGSVTYEKAVAVDASGAQMTLPIVWTGTEAHIVVPASFVERAQLPLVIDPMLSVVNGIGSPTTELQRDPDVATIQWLTRTCVVWEREWSATDRDVWAQLYDGTMTAIGGIFSIDFTGLDWREPAVAGNDWSVNFLVVGQVQSGPLYYIAGRRIAGAGGALGAQFDIEKSGVASHLLGNNFRPDIGGDFYQGNAAYWCVVWEHEFTTTDHDIYCKCVRQDGALLTASPVTIDAATTNESNPCISKQCGGPATWFVAYQRTWVSAPFDQDVRGRFVSWDGFVQAPTPWIGSSTANDTRPATSSPVLAGGSWYWLAAYENDIAGPRDILCRVYDSTGAWVAGFNLNVAQQGGAYQAADQQRPDCDSDGVRFVVGYTEPFPGWGDFETHVSTLAYLPATTALVIQDDRIGLGTSLDDEFGPRICSLQSGGGVPSPRFMVVDANWTDNAIDLYDYGGWQTGTQFAIFPSACGPLTIGYSGSTAVGGTVTITVPNGPLSGTIFGYPGLVPLNVLGCNCVSGVQNGLLMGNPLVFTIPPNPVFVGALLSVQGWTAIGSNCLGFVDLSDTVDFTVR